MFATLSIANDANMSIATGLNDPDVDTIAITASVTITPAYPHRICCLGAKYPSQACTRLCDNGRIDRWATGDLNKSQGRMIESCGQMLGSHINFRFARIAI